MLRCLLEGVRWLRLVGVELAVATKSAVTRARVRLGTAPVRALFERLACPFATPGAPGAWYRGRRLVSLDGTTLDLPDAPELRHAMAGQARHAGQQLSSCACWVWRSAAPTRSSRWRWTATRPARSAGAGRC